MYIECIVLFVLTYNTKIISFYSQQEDRIFRNFHRQVFCWMDQWYGLTMVDIRRIEDQTKEELDSVTILIHFTFSIKATLLTYQFIIIISYLWEFTPSLNQIYRYLVKSVFGKT